VIGREKEFVYESEKVFMKENVQVCLCVRERE
jgi:hypothetical protein